jgi:hypothetical protein
MAYVNYLTDHNIAISLCLNPLENAYEERVNGIIKNEYLKYGISPIFQHLYKNAGEPWNIITQNDPTLIFQAKKHPWILKRFLYF